MFFRAIALSLALLLGIGTIISLTTDSIEAGPKYKKHKKKKLRKYSRAWWRWYHKQQRKKRALLARKRAIRARQILLAKRRTPIFPQPLATMETGKKPESTVTAAPKSKNKPPKNPIQIQPINGEPLFRVIDENGSQIGTASLTLINPAEETDSKNATDKIGDVSTKFLLRNAVEEILKERGWIVNDFQKNINNKKVYVVTGQSLVNGVYRSHYFYFTEVGGKIYRLSTICPKDAKERTALESERVIESLQRGNFIVQSASK